MDPDGCQDGAQVRRQEVGLQRLLAGMVTAGSRHDVGRPVAQQTDLPLRRAHECAPDAHDMVDPGLQRRGHGVVVHRCRDHHHVRGFQFADHLLRVAQRIAVRRSPLLRTPQDRVGERGVDGGRRIGGEIAAHHLRGRMPAFQPREQFLAEAARPRFRAARTDLRCTGWTSCRLDGDRVLRTEPDRQPVPQVDQADQRGQIHQFRLAELRPHLVIHIIRSVRVGNPRQRLGPCQGRPFAVAVERRFAPRVEQIQPLLGLASRAVRPCCACRGNRRSR